jgi:hypothetical protein
MVAAAFYHGNDRQNLGVFIAIARRHRVSMDEIRGWSIAERVADGVTEFLDELRRTHRARARAGNGRALRRGARR